MSDFFARLAARTLMKAPLAQPLRPSRFADGSGLDMVELPPAPVEQPLEALEALSGFSDDQALVGEAAPTEEFSRALSRDDAPSVGVQTPTDGLDLDIPSPDQGFPLIPEQDSAFAEAEGSNLPKSDIPQKPDFPKQAAQSQSPQAPARLVDVEASQPTPSTPDDTEAAFQITNLRPSPVPTLMGADQPSTVESTQIIERDSPPPRLIPPKTDLLSGWTSPPMAAAEPIPENIEIAESQLQTNKQPHSKPAEEIPWQTARAVIPETMPRQKQPQKSPPEIRVTIGRVEVRAVSPPAKPSYQPPAPRRPSLSLNDYLKQRNENQK